MAAETAFRAGGRPGAALAVSLLIHAALLLLPINTSPRRTIFPLQPAGTDLRLMLRPLAADNAHRPSPVNTPATAPARAAPPAWTARPTLPRQRGGEAIIDAPPLPAEPRDEPAHTLLDPDALHAQILDAVRQGTKAPFPSASPATPTSTQRDTPTLFDRPLLDALARRVGRPLHVVSEQRLADGSWRIRFAGGVCMHVPREQPAALDNPFGPNVALTTNCSD